MKRKIVNVCLIVILMLVININNVYATSGALRKNSIKTCPNGLTYGYHSSSGQTHWHQAEAHSEMSSGWAAVGEPLSGDPCPNNDNNSNQNSSNENNNSNDNQSNTNQSNNNSQESNTSTNNNQTSTTNKPNKKSDDTSINKLIINDKNFYSIDDTMEYASTSDKVKIEVETTDENATYEIQGNVDELSKDKSNEIKILVTAEDGTQKSYILNITREIKESYVRITTLKVNGSSVYFSSDNKDEVSISNGEDKLNIEYELSNENASLIITKDGKEVKNGSEIKIGKNNYLLTIIDEDGNEYSYDLVVERMTFLDTIVTYILGIATLIGIGYLVYYFAVKKKKQ